MIADVLTHLGAGFEKTIESYKRDLSKVRTGRASLNLLDGIKVDYYGTMTPLNQVAALNVPDPRLITVKPWEKTLVAAVEKAIRAHSELGLNPVSDGDLVRVPIPALTAERRKDLVKVVKKMGEEAKVALRGVRREGNDKVKALVDGGKITEDDSKKGLKQIQDVTDKFIAQIDDVGTKKEKEILDV